MSVKTSGTPEPVRQCPRLGRVTVTQPDQLDAAHLRQNGQMRELRDRASPSSPTRTRSVMAGSLQDHTSARMTTSLALTGEGRAGIVRRQDRPVVLPRARTADRTPLAHPDSMPIASTPQREPRDRATANRFVSNLKIGAVEDLAIGLAQHESDVVATHMIGPTARRDSEPRDAT